MKTLILFPVRLVIVAVYSTLFIMKEVGERGCDFIEDVMLK